MICAPIDTEGPRFYVSRIEGWPITSVGRETGDTAPVLVATVIDSFYGTEHGRFASNDRQAEPPLRPVDPLWGKTCACGKPKGYSSYRCHECGARRGRHAGYLGRENTLAAAAARCAELNAWHEREGWGEDVPLIS